MNFISVFIFIFFSLSALGNETTFQSEALTFAFTHNYDRREGYELTEILSKNRGLVAKIKTKLKTHKRLLWVTPHLAPTEDFNIHGSNNIQQARLKLSEALNSLPQIPSIRHLGAPSVALVRSHLGHFYAVIYLKKYPTLAVGHSFGNRFSGVSFPNFEFTAAVLIDLEASKILKVYEFMLPFHDKTSNFQEALLELIDADLWTDLVPTKTECEPFLISLFQLK